MKEQSCNYTYFDMIHIRSLQHVLTHITMEQGSHNDVNEHPMFNSCENRSTYQIEDDRIIEALQKYKIQMLYGRV